MFQEFILPMTILYVVIAIIGFAIYKIDKELDEKLPKKD
jgi:hypothetical protein